VDDWWLHWGPWGWGTLTRAKSGSQYPIQGTRREKDPEPAAEKFDNAPADDPVTDASATPGRVLFYDTRLSANNTVSCGSCHAQAHAFVDPSRFRTGFKGGLTVRFWESRPPSSPSSA
jgi:cytochrome c peroxidase